MREVERLYSVCAAAVLLGVGRSTLYKAVGRGEVRVVKILGGRTRITASELVRQGASWAVDGHLEASAPADSSPR